jgi:glycosyltransferase involved in cell wall biosynthesis
MISVVVTVHNKEDMIGQVIKGIIDNMSRRVIELVVVLDGCTDASEQIIRDSIGNEFVHVNYLYADDVWEVKANNIGMKACIGRHAILVQDDMIITEKDFDQRFMKPFKKVKNLMAVTARNAHDTRLVNGTIDFLPPAGKDMGSPRDVLYVRDGFIRGPVMLDMYKVHDLGYLDEYFAPQTNDDFDLSFRAYRKGWLVGAYMVGYESETSWGTTRKLIGDKLAYLENADRENRLKLVEKHADLIGGPKHTEDIAI